ncbi:MAG: dihydrodipicolinate synthase family protein, partial [Verrucomicrobiales bacterium]|nr:dihydrodipicolinate synthase family protein [Verrucomicrobiales bacterium]
VGDAEKLHDQYGSLFEAFLKLDTNPVPIKASLGLAGKCDSRLRLPMVQMSDEKVAELKNTLENLGLI